jgi:ubiquinone/menaquinone biosynthesis C-methylase UbiE
MPFIFYFFVVLAIVVILIALIWRASSGQLLIPCPSWLGWLVEMDNPFLKNNSAREIIPHLHLINGMKILDFGCGPGRLTIPIARQIGTSGMVTAFDIQPEMLARVRAKAEQEKFVNIEYIQGAAGEGKLKKNEFDRVLLVTVLGEIPDKEEAIKEIYESLKSGGLLSITEVIADPHFQTRKKVTEVVGSVGFKEVAFFGSRISYTINFEKP